VKDDSESGTNPALQNTAESCWPVLTLEDYRSLVADLPRPTGDQIDDFVCYFAGARSWYKRLPVLQPGTPFYFFVDPHAPEGPGLEVSESAARVIPASAGGGHYSWLPAGVYRRRFGPLTYQRSSEGVIWVEGRGYCSIPREVAVAGCAALTAIVYSDFRVAGPLFWMGHFTRDLLSNESPWPEESGGCKVLQRLVELNEAFVAGHQRSAVGDEIERDWGPLGEFTSLLLPERRRLWQTVRDAVVRVCLLIFGPDAEFNRRGNWPYLDQLGFPEVTRRVRDRQSHVDVSSVWQCPFCEQPVYKKEKRHEEVRTRQCENCGAVIFAAGHGSVGKVVAGAAHWFGIPFAEVDRGPQSIEPASFLAHNIDVAVGGFLTLLEEGRIAERFLMTGFRSRAWCGGLLKLPPPEGMSRRLLGLILDLQPRTLARLREVWRMSNVGLLQKADGVLSFVDLVKWLTAGRSEEDIVGSQELMGFVFLGLLDIGNDLDVTSIVLRDGRRGPLRGCLENCCTQSAPGWPPPVDGAKVWAFYRDEFVPFAESGRQ
jgi:hypothetical protein